MLTVNIPAGKIYFSALNITVNGCIENTKRATISEILTDWLTDLTMIQDCGFQKYDKQLSQFIRKKHTAKNKAKIRSLRIWDWGGINNQFWPEYSSLFHVLKHPFLAPLEFQALKGEGHYCIHGDTESWHFRKIFFYIFLRFLGFLRLFFWDFWDFWDFMRFLRIFLRFLKYPWKMWQRFFSSYLPIDGVYKMRSWSRPSTPSASTSDARCAWSCLQYIFFIL